MKPKTEEQLLREIRQLKRDLVKVKSENKELKQHTTLLKEMCNTLGQDLKESYADNRKLKL
jgi:RNA-binding protein YhbY